MTQPHLEKIFYHYVRNNTHLFDIVDERFFSNKALQECFKVDKKWHLKYSQVPSKSNLIESLRQSKVQGISDDEITAIFKEEISDYDSEWLKENSEAWIELKQLNLSFYDAAALVKGTEITPDNIQSIIGSVKDIFLTRNSIDFSFSSGLDFFNADSHFQAESNTITSGYPFLDACMDGGWEMGSVVVFMAPPKSYKSTLLGNIAANSVQLGYNTLYLTLELSDKKVIKRVGSNLLNIPIDEYSESSRNKALIKEKIDDVGSAGLREPGKFFVKQWPASTAGVPDIENYIKKIQEITGFKFTIVVIDYLNLLKNWRNPNTENTFMKIKQISEDLRAMATRLNLCVVSATQVGRTGYGSTNLGMNDVSESRALTETVDALFGIQQDMAMRMNGQIDLKAIALRNSGGMGNHKLYDIDQNYMRIIEDPNSNVMISE